MLSPCFRLTIPFLGWEGWIIAGVPWFSHERLRCTKKNLPDQNRKSVQGPKFKILIVHLSLLSDDGKVNASWQRHQAVRYGNSRRKWRLRCIFWGLQFWCMKWISQDKWLRAFFSENDGPIKAVATQEGEFSARKTFLNPVRRIHVRLETHSSRQKFWISEFPNPHLCRGVRPKWATRRVSRFASTNRFPPQLCIGEKNTIFKTLIV